MSRAIVAVVVALALIGLLTVAALVAQGYGIGQGIG